MPRLRQTLGWAIAGLILFTLLLAGIGSVGFVRAMLLHDFQYQLASQTRAFATIYMKRGGIPRLPYGDHVAIYGPDGSLLASVGSVPRTAPAPGFSDQSGAMGYAQPLANGQTFFLSASLGPVHAPVRLLERALVVLALIALAVGLLVAHLLARQISRPLSDLASAAGRIAETGDLEESLPRGGRIAEVRDLSGALGRMLATLRGVFSALETQEARTRALREGILHDLRTPLTTVLGTLELVQGGQLKGPAATQALDLARREAKRMASRLAEDSEGAEAMADLAEAVRRAGKGHEVAEGPQEIRVAAPPQELSQVLSLLVDNAERHNPPGTPIRLSFGREGPLGWALVEDFGDGMSDEVLRHAFDRFYRGPKSGGLGLGLALVKVLVESREGQVDLSSVPGEGTKVRVSWPLAEEGA